MAGEGCWNWDYMHKAVIGCAKKSKILGLWVWSRKERLRTNATELADKKTAFSCIVDARTTTTTAIAAITLMLLPLIKNLTLQSLPSFQSQVLSLLPVPVKCGPILIYARLQFQIKVHIRVTWLVETKSYSIF